MKGDPHSAVAVVDRLRRTARGVIRGRGFGLSADPGVGDHFAQGVDLLIGQWRQGKDGLPDVFSLLFCQVT